MNGILEAAILLAGSGSRLRAGGRTILKPLVPVLGRPLISYTIDALAGAGIKTVYAVVGFESETMIGQVEPLVPAGLEVRFIHNPDWQKQNGISVLSAANYLTRPFLLTMSDHLFDQTIFDLLMNAATADSLYLAIDRKISTIFDLQDAMKVQMKDDLIVTIGKNLSDYNAIDTGLFVCPPELFAYLNRAKRDGDCSLADGVQLMADDGKARGVDIAAGWWQDVDTPEMLHQAERKLAERSKTQMLAR
ncbi:MAG: 1L-myo-inositol 1-phosphate cytidylyltransferase [Verrucomicrobiota bacterium]|jgi:choline kinase